MTHSRRTFFLKSGAAFSALAALPVLAQSPAPDDQSPPDDPNRPRQKLGRVQAFVQAAHSDLGRVRAMLAEEPNLINASWDWGNGDWETALEGASHMAQIDTIAFLLQNGARANLFSMATLGHHDAVMALIRTEPALGQTRGPHFLTLLFHAALSGQIKLTAAIAEQLEGDVASHFNQALRGVAQLGTVAMADWLLGHGVTNVNETNFWNETPLDVSIQRGDEAMAALLQRHGGVRNSPGLR